MLGPALVLLVAGAAGLYLDALRDTRERASSAPPPPPPADPITHVRRFPK